MRGSLPRWPVLAVFVVLAAVVSPPSQAGEQLRLKPVDQADRDREFSLWRKDFIEAVRRRDVDYVVARAAANIKLSFGGDYGPDTFRQFLTGNVEWQGEAYWRELQTVLELGGVFMEDGAFCSPYLACIDVPGCDECDPYETVYVVRADAVARQEPKKEAAVAAKLSWNVLPLDYEADSPAGWYAVKLWNGRTAYLSDGDARMAVDYRARFERKPKGWRMTVFIAGD